MLGNARMSHDHRTATLRFMNDQFRKTFRGGQLMLSSGVRQLPRSQLTDILQRVRIFADFTEDNDPHGEHDFGSLFSGDQQVFWKLDYYDTNLEYASPNPLDPDVTIRVLTIMLASEY